MQKQNVRRKPQGRLQAVSLRWLSLLVMAVLVVVLLNLPAVASGARHYTELKFAPLPKVQLPPYTRYQLDNGMVVYLIEDH